MMVGLLTNRPKQNYGGRSHSRPSRLYSIISCFGVDENTHTRHRQVASRLATVRRGESGALQHAGTEAGKRAPTLPRVTTSARAPVCR